MITVDPDKPIRDQIDTPENRSAIEGVVLASLGIEGGTGEAHAPDGSLWAEMASDAQVPPITFTTARKDIHAALSRTQHALAPDEPDSRPVITCWWLSVARQKLTIHTADNLTDDPDEVATMAARLHRRSTHVHETASALDATAARMRTEAAARLEPSGTLWGQP